VSRRGGAARFDITELSSPPDARRREGMINHHQRLPGMRDGCLRWEPQKWVISRSVPMYLGLLGKPRLWGQR